MRYGVIGTGAIGGYYGARLAQSGQDVHFLLHSDYEYVRAKGLTVDSCNGSFCLAHPNIYKSAGDMPSCDVVLVCLKSVNNSLLSELLPPLLHKASEKGRGDSLVVLIQNGIGVEADVQAVFPEVQLAAGLAFICSAKAGPGHINHQCYGQMNIGNYSCRDEARVLQVIDDFNAAGVKCGQVEYHEARWKKAVWNMPFNGMTVAMKAQTDELLRHPATRELIYQQMMEVVGAARHLGVKGLDKSFADLMMEMTDNMTPYSPSMRLDYDNRRPMEIHYLYRRPIQIAGEAGYAMPRLEMLMRELQFIEDSYSASREG